MKKALILIIVCLLLGTLAPSAYADVPYKTFTVDHSMKFVRTQDAYTPVASIESAGDEGGFKEPADVYIDKDDRIYVADSGNSRVVVLDAEGRLLRTIGGEALQTPTGVFVDGAGNVYVADSGAAQVFKFDAGGKQLAAFGKPESPLYGKNSPYKPLKVAVDKRGNVYVLSEGNSNGAVQFSPHGDFLGYFGSNDPAVSLKLVLQRFFFTKEQRVKLFRSVPPTPTNIAIDDKGLVYTVTEGVEGNAIKKFNISGANLLPKMWAFPNHTDLFVARNGNIYAVTQDGFIDEYDTEGNLLFAFGAPDDGKSRIGLFVSAVGIAVNSKNRVYVLDKERNNLQVFEPTEFTQQVHQALQLYKEGYYVKSQQPWTEVLRKNNLFDLAHKGLADAYFKQQRYDEALDEYVIAGDRLGYSNAFWEIRNNWLQRHLLDVFLIVAGIYIALRLLKWWHLRTGVFRQPLGAVRSVAGAPLVKQWLFLFTMIRRPVEGFGAIKDENKASAWSASIWYFIFFVEYLIGLYYTSFIFNGVEPTSINLVRELLYVFVPFALWVIANFLVSTINEGEGKFSHVYKATIYAFAPYLIFRPLIVIASNGLTLNDAFVYQFANGIVIAWTVLLVFLMVKETHDYTIKESLKNIAITLFCMLIMVLVLFIVYVLLDQVYDFVQSVIEELIVRADQ